MLYTNNWYNFQIISWIGKKENLKNICAIYSSDM